MNKIHLTGALIASLTIGSSVFAAEKAKQQVRINYIGAGLANCEKVVADAKANEQTAALTYGSWVNGYLSGMNQIAVSAKGPQVLMNAGGVWNAVKSYCAKNPKEYVATLAGKLRVSALQSQAAAAKNKAAEKK